jgi:hypothetical protein
MSSMLAHETQKASTAAKESRLYRPTERNW